MGTVKSIYKQFGWVFSAEYEAIITAHLAEDAQKRADMKEKRSQGKGETLHHYTPEEFSVTTKELSEGAFAAYSQKFHVPMSKN